MRTLSHLLVGFTLLAALSGCANVIKLEEPKVNLVGIESVKGNSMSPRFVLRLMVTNPNDRDLDIEGMAFDFNVGKHNLMSGVANNIPTLTAYGETAVDVEASINVIDMVMLVAKFAESPNDNLTYTLRTRIDPKGYMAFDIKHSGQLDKQLEDAFKTKR
ncbi:LEA type 2 family protein [Thalassotalea ponticola]|uniref:LEA type 2 family protein n=1 Tax=Thalassotalea ponticola TaxID=1523392 RepID=UPI0025B4EEFC|nr:LEA type 2 family protein [Thalassotalea ponticola]MDN3651487.1 LEA type 2 family protein [Thalassotalea ponticola]